MNTNLSAFTWFICDCEGTIKKDGTKAYGALYGWRADMTEPNDRYLTDFSAHPKRKFHFDGREIVPPEVPQSYQYTSAAGAYQATGSTWDDFEAARGPHDFSPASQDEFCEWRISIVPGALYDIAAGRFDDAIEKLKPVWESFQKRTPSWMREKLQQRLHHEQGIENVNTTGKIFGGDPHTEPPSTTTTDEEQTTVLPIIAALAPTLLEMAARALPAIASLWTDDKVSVRERNAQTAVKVLDVVSEAVNARSHQEAVNIVTTDPAAAQAANAAILAQFYSLQKEAMANEAQVWEREEKSRADARAFADQMTNNGPEWRQIGWGALLGLLSLLIILGGGIILSNVLFQTSLDQATRSSIVQWFQNIILMVVAYYFGSSNGSRAKDVMLQQQQQAASQAK